MSSKERTGWVSAGKKVGNFEKKKIQKRSDLFLLLYSLASKKRSRLHRAVIKVIKKSVFKTTNTTNYDLK